MESLIPKVEQFVFCFVGEDSFYEPTGMSQEVGKWLVNGL